MHPERIIQNYKKFNNGLNYDGVGFPVREKDFSKIETKNNVCINVFPYENRLTFPIYISNQKFWKLDVFVAYNWWKQVTLCLFLFHKTKSKNKKYFCKSCLQCFSSRKILTEHKEVCLNINGAQSVRLEKGTIEFKNYYKQIPVPFRVYADFECNVKIVEGYGGSYSKKYQNHIACSFAYKLVCVDNEFSKPIVVYRGVNAARKFLKRFWIFEYCKKVIKKHFNKNLIKSEEEEQFQLSNTCWICKKLIDDDMKK